MRKELIGQRLKTIREMRNISQGDFGRRVKKDQAAISAYESGKRKIPAHELARFAVELDVPVLYFYTGHLANDSEITQEEWDAVFEETESDQERKALIRLAREYLRIQRETQQEDEDEEASNETRQRRQG